MSEGQAPSSQTSSFENQCDLCSHDPWDSSNLRNSSESTPALGLTCVGPISESADQAQILREWGLMRTTACSVCGVVAETRQIHMDYQVLWRKRDSTATLSRGEHLGAPPPLSQEKSAWPLPWQAFIHFLDTSHRGWSSFTMYRFALGGYLLQKQRRGCC